MEAKTDDTIERYLTQLSTSVFLSDIHTPESFEYMLDYYRDRSTTKRKWFRYSSVSIIVLSGLLPLIAVFATDTVVYGFPISKSFLVSAASAVIAILTGIGTHFRWEVGWRSQTEALFALQALRADWEASIAIARASNSADRLGELETAFGRFRVQTYEIVHAEMGDFFKVQQAPPARVSATP